jgi:predicted transcriptional regulator
MAPMTKTKSFCPTCQMEFANIWFHREGVLHRHHERIKKLLRKQCISFSEIADRVGITRERVRQIARTMGITPGRQRMSACALTRRDAQFHSDPKFSRLRRRTSDLNLTLEPFPSKHRWQVHRVIINGKPCKLTSAKLYGNSVVLSPKRVHPDVDFVIVSINNRTFMVFPTAQYPKKGTKFSMTLNPHSSKGITHTHRHDWRDYIEAWHLLGEASAKDEIGA